MVNANAEADEFLRCSAFGNLWMNRAASSRMASWLPAGREIGFRPTTSGLSGNGHRQGRSACL